MLTKLQRHLQMENFPLILRQHVIITKKDTNAIIMKKDMGAHITVLIETELQ